MHVLLVKHYIDVGEVLSVMMDVASLTSTGGGGLQYSSHTLQVMRQLTEIWKSAEISLKLKKQLVKSLVWSIALYGSESWAVKKCDEKWITAFELWCWRRVLRISWTEYKTNVWVRQKIGVPEQNGLLEQLKKRKLAKYGHWKRRSEGLVMAVTEGEIEGKCLPVDGEQHG